PLGPHRELDPLGPFDQPRVALVADLDVDSLRVGGELGHLAQLLLGVATEPICYLGVASNDHNLHDDLHAHSRLWAFIGPTPRRSLRCGVPRSTTSRKSRQTGTSRIPSA